MAPEDRKSGVARGQFKKSGRPEGSARCYAKKNKPIEAPTLRRDLSAHEKLRILWRYEDAARAEGVHFLRLSVSKRQALEKLLHWKWEVIKAWFALKPIFIQTIAKLRLGVRGIRPFGSTKKATACAGHRNKGARIQQVVPGKTTPQRPLEAVMFKLEKWFKKEREHNHEVRKKTILTQLKMQLECERDIQLVKQETECETFSATSLRACQERLQTFEIISPSHNQDTWFERVVCPRIYTCPFLLEARIQTPI